MSASSYTEREPATGVPGLACVWTQELSVSGQGYTQRVVPDGCVDLIWSSVTGSIVVAGPDTRPHLEVLERGDRLVGVRFRPGAAPPILGVPADAVRDGRIPLAELWRDHALRLADQVAGAADPLAVLERGVVVRLRRSDPADPTAPTIVRDLADGHRVQAVADRLGFSDRQLRRRSIAAFGYGPKTLQRILRFQRALALARQGVPYAEVAFDAGYADQPHLSREVAELTGVTLTDLL